jgi:hypothetical protein
MLVAETRVVPVPLARTELDVSKRLRKRKVSGGSECLGANQGFALLRTWVDPTPPEKRPLRSLLLHVRALVGTKLVRRDFGSWAHALDLRRAFRRGTFCPGGPEGPVELKLLGLMALRTLDEAAVLEVCGADAAAHYGALVLPLQGAAARRVALLKGWKTWDLVALAHLWKGRRPAFLERCLHYDPAQRPSVDECLRAFS